MAARTITHFMWGYQQHFRISLEVAIKFALESIGADLSPRAYLVGLRADSAARFDYCVEPENEPIGLADLTGVESRAHEIYEANEDRHVINTHPDVHASFQAGLRDQARRGALCEALQAASGGYGYDFFAGRSVRIGDYAIYPVVAVKSSRWRALPILETRKRNLVALDPSIGAAVINAVLGDASTSMSQKTPPSELLGDAEDIVRSAARRFVQSVGIRAGEWNSHGLQSALDAVAAQPYEGRSGAGTIVLGQPGPSVEIDMNLVQHVSIHSTRAFRKILEMSGPDLHILCDGEKIFGLGRISRSYDPSSETVFSVTVVGRGSWQIAHNNVPLLRGDNTRASLPRARISRENFADTVSRIFSGVSDSDVETLWDLADVASSQEHGTMLVVHRKAAEEAARLEPQALRLEPTRLTASMVRAVTNIDGAVLVSPDAECHAVGVILDGRASGIGDSSRGARYNSAIRYCEAAGDNCLIIIVSEDGMIDLLPSLKPRVSRDDVARAVVDLVGASQGSIDFGRFHRLDEAVEAVEFYLNAHQCAEVNAARERVEDYREKSNHMRMIRRPISPNPDMDESYFL